MQRILAAHNAARSAIGLAPLTWNARMAEDARQWAVHLAQTGEFSHAGSAGRSGNGENLWAGTKGRYSPDDMVGAWTAEKRFFRTGRFPANSSDGRWESVAHYTQIIWRETREIGCGLAAGKSLDVLVCRYGNPGNILGQMPY